MVSGTSFRNRLMPHFWRRWPAARVRRLRAAIPVRRSSVSTKAYSRRNGAPATPSHSFFHRVSSSGAQTGDANNGGVASNNVSVLNDSTSNTGNSGNTGGVGSTNVSALNSGSSPGNSSDSTVGSTNVGALNSGSSTGNAGSGNAPASADVGVLNSGSNPGTPFARMVSVEALSPGYRLRTLDSRYCQRLREPCACDVQVRPQRRTAKGKLGCTKNLTWRWIFIARAKRSSSGRYRGRLRFEACAFAERVRNQKYPAFFAFHRMPSRSMNRPCRLETRLPRNSSMRR
jgi:hypothetical protein